MKAIADQFALPLPARRTIPFVPGVAMLSNLQAAALVVQPYAEAGSDPEAVEALAAINNFIDAVAAKTILPNL